MSTSIPTFVLLLLIVIVITVIACVVVRCRLRFSKADETTEPSNEDDNIYDEVDVGKTESEHCNIKMTGNPAYGNTYDEVDVWKTESEHCNIKMTGNPACSDTTYCVIVD